MPEPSRAPSLAYEHLPRPRELTIEENEHSTIIRVPPPPVWQLVVRLVLFGLLSIIVMYAAAIGLGGRRAHWADWGRVVWVVILLGLGALRLLTSARESRSWTMIETAAMELSISLYDKEVWSHMRWPRDEITSVAAMRGDLQWNFRRPRFLRIRLSRGHQDLLHGLPLADLKHIARILCQRLGLSA